MADQFNIIVVLMAGLSLETDVKDMLESVLPNCRRIRLINPTDLTDTLSLNKLSQADYSHRLLSC